MAWIEIIGLPGAGKSTLLGQLKEAHGPRLPELLGPIDPGGAAMMVKLAQLSSRLAVRRPDILMKLTRSPEGRWILGKLAYRWAGQSKRANSGILIDSGTLQPLISLPAEYTSNTMQSDAILTLKSVVPTAPYILFLDVGVNVAYRRYKERQKLTGRRADAHVQESGFLQAQQICDSIADGHDQDKIMKIKSSVSDPKLLDDMQSKILNWFSRNGKL